MTAPDTAQTTSLTTASTRSRAAFALAVISLACMVGLTGTYDYFADRWLTATPWALMGWAGFIAALAGMVVGEGRLRALPAAFALAWVAFFVLTFSDPAQDAVASVRRATFAFIAF